MMWCQNLGGMGNPGECFQVKLLKVVGHDETTRLNSSLVTTATFSIFKPQETMQALCRAPHSYHTQQHPC